MIGEHSGRRRPEDGADVSGLNAESSKQPERDQIQCRSEAPRRLHSTGRVYTNTSPKPEPAPEVLTRVPTATTQLSGRNVTP